MTVLEIWLLAIGLAMDCFAVSIASGILLKQIRIYPMLQMAFLFGLFQAMMPIFGWFAATQFSHLVENIDHWIAFGILAFLGGRMIINSFKEEEEKQSYNPAKLRTAITLAIATSIDAMAVGISFACVGMKHFQELVFPINIIGLVSFILSIVGLLIGICFGKTIAKRLKAELWGGIILLCIGIKILVEHLFFC